MIPPRRFDPTVDWAHRTELGDHVQALVEKGRYRPAMDAVLGRLRRNPADIDALVLALIIFTSSSRTARVESVEPTTLQQEDSALLAPIATVCSECESLWHSPHTLEDPGQLIVPLNPLGLQCQECRYTLCRNCREWTEGVDLRQPCPDFLCGGTLTTPVLPTGRPDIEPTDPMTIEGIVVVRDGPIPPTVDEAMPVVTKFVPLLVDDAPNVTILPSSRGMMADHFSRSVQAMSMIERLEQDRTLETGAWERATSLFVSAGVADDTDYHVTVVRWPGSFAIGHLLHVEVLREGSEQIDPDSMMSMLEVLVPRVFDDGPTISGGPAGGWTDDPQGLLLAVLARRHAEYLADGYTVRVQQSRDREGLRWAIATVTREG